MTVWGTSSPDDQSRLELREVVPGALDVSLVMTWAGRPTEMVLRLPRERVQEMTAAVDDWLFDTRPGA